jgi:hypothetical protein
VKDPWRIVDPLTPPKESTRIDPSDRDVDWDFRPHQSCVVRFKACAIEVSSRDIETERDALEVLAKCVLDLKKAQFRSETIIVDTHAKYGQVMWDVPPKDTPSARLECEGVVIWFANETIDRGALRLVRALLRATRLPKFAPILKRHGVVPMLRS